MSTLAQRDMVYNALIAAGINVDKQNMSPSQLRCDSAALGTTQNIQFNFQKLSNTTASATSILLGNNDVFVVTDIALQIKQCADTASGHALAYYQTFFSSLIFTGATNDPNMKAIYNSVLSVIIDRVQYIPSLSTAVFERIGTSQQGTTTTAYVNASTANATTTIARSEKTHALWGFYPVVPFVLKGNSETQQISITLPTSLNLTADANSNFASLVFNGFLITNAIR